MRKSSLYSYPYKLLPEGGYTLKSSLSTGCESYRLLCYGCRPRQKYGNLEENVHIRFKTFKIFNMLTKYWKDHKALSNIYPLTEKRTKRIN